MHSTKDLPDAHLRVFDRPPVPPPEEIESVYLIGICGTGMGTLAGLLHEAGYDVAGSDEAAYPPMSTRLAEDGISVDEGYDPENLRRADPDLVVVGNACTPTHPEATYARENKLVQLSFPGALRHFFLSSRTALVVAGTHGKTTTTGMLVQLLADAGYDPGFMIGGVMQGYERSYKLGGQRYVVVEGDEYDSAYFDKRPKFMHYKPEAAIITSMEFDHADIYSDWDDYRSAFRAFAETMPEGDLLVLNGDDPEVRALADVADGARVRFFGLEGGDDDVTATDVRTTPEGQHFTLVVDGHAEAEVFLPISGRHNLLDALAASAVALDEGLSPQQVADGFAAFQGMKRRQEVRGEEGGVLVIDDFAHHPTAVRETIRAGRERWPDRRLMAVFEPCSNSSRRKTFEEEYGRAFDQAACAFLSTPPQKDSDPDADLMDAGAVVRTISERGVPAHLYNGADALIGPLSEELRPGDVALIMSNGGFGNLHERLLERLADGQSRSRKE
jgi:UDP-N-acetylmuramate: L-alanyl-gamma-D-glutamyl-meso-diaminopimelate ligase